MTRDQKVQKIKESGYILKEYKRLHTKSNRKFYSANKGLEEHFGTLNKVFKNIFGY